MSGDCNFHYGNATETPLRPFTSGTVGGRFDPVSGEATMCGIEVETDDRTGLALKAAAAHTGGNLKGAEAGPLELGLRARLGATPITQRDVQPRPTSLKPARQDRVVPEGRTQQNLASHSTSRIDGQMPRDLVIDACTDKRRSQCRCPIPEMDPHLLNEAPFHVIENDRRFPQTSRRLEVEFDEMPHPCDRFFRLTSFERPDDFFLEQGIGILDGPGGYFIFATGENREEALD